MHGAVPEIDVKSCGCNCFCVGHPFAALSMEAGRMPKVSDRMCFGIRDKLSNGTRTPAAFTNHKLSGASPEGLDEAGVVGGGV